MWVFFHVYFCACSLLVEFHISGAVLSPGQTSPTFFAQQMPTMLGTNVALVWLSMLGVVGRCWILLDVVG